MPSGPIPPTKLKRVGDQAQALEHLASEPGWEVLKERLKARQDAHFARVQRELMAGVEIDQRHIDRMAGWFAGARWLLRNPDIADNELRKALERAELFGVIEEEK